MQELKQALDRRLRRELSRCKVTAEMQEVKALGEELLREPVKRVNHVAKLLKVLTADPSQVIRSPHPSSNTTARRVIHVAVIFDTGFQQECSEVFEAFLFSFF